MKTFLAIIVLPLFLSACLESPGTNTGNPGKEPVSMPGGDTNGNNPALTYTKVLVGLICAKVKVCYPSSNSATCYTNGMEQSGYTSELGATAATYDTMEDLATAVENNTVVINTTNYESCTQALNALNCSDTLVQNAYSAATPSDYSATNILFRASTACQQIY